MNRTNVRPERMRVLPARAAWIALLAFTLSLPFTVGAQASYQTNQGSVTLTSYVGSGPVVVPGTLGDLPVTGIGPAAFGCAAQVTSVAIPASITNIGDSAFRGALSLNSITVDAPNLTYSSVDGVLFDKGQSTLIQFPQGRTGNYRVPDGVAHLESGAFWSCGVTNVSLPNTVVTMGQHVFALCQNLASIELPDSLTSIPAYTFHECSALASVRIGNGVADIGESAFDRCTKLTSLTIPDNLTSIGRQAFASCLGLRSVFLGKGIKWLDEEAFNSCYGLKAAYFLGDAPGTDPIPDYSVFSYDESATVYYFPGTTGWGPTFCGRPTAPWALSSPVILSTATNHGAWNGGFGFTISWVTNAIVVVEANPNPATANWSSISTNVLINGWWHFTDPAWTNYRSRYYRARWP